DDDRDQRGDDRAVQEGHRAELVGRRVPDGGEDPAPARGAEPGRRLLRGRNDDQDEDDQDEQAGGKGEPGEGPVTERSSLRKRTGGPGWSGRARLCHGTHGYAAEVILLSCATAAESIDDGSGARSSWVSSFCPSP